MHSLLILMPLEKGDVLEMRASPIVTLITAKLRLKLIKKVHRQ